MRTATGRRIAAFGAKVPEDRIAAASDATERFERALDNHRLLGTRTSAAKALPVNFWQSRQWHTVALAGSASAV